MELHYVALLTFVSCVYGNSLYDRLHDNEYEVPEEQNQLQRLFDTEYEEEQNQLEVAQSDLKDTVNNVLRDKLDGARETIDSLRQRGAMDTGGGSTYIRWGRTTCPNGRAEMVYTGYAAGAHYTQSGGGANYLCLPMKPTWGEGSSDSTGAQAQIYGVEYKMNIRDTSNYKHDAPCTVCRVPQASVLMIPGRKICYDGWTLQYSGNLVAGHYGDKHASEFVCLDGWLERVNGGYRGDDGASFYNVEGMCGSLKCPPYEHARPLKCVVCSY